MPDHRLERFRQRRDPGGIHLRDDDDHVAMSRGVSGILADDPEHLGGALLREVDRADKIGADVALGVPPPTENIKSASSASSRLVSSQAAKTLSQPSSLVRAVNSETLSIGL